MTTALERPRWDRKNEPFSEYQKRLESYVAQYRNQRSKPAETVRHQQIIEQRITAVKVEMDEVARARISELERQMADLIARLDAATAKVIKESQEPVADLSENFADLMLADETVEDARERLTRQLVYLRHVLIAPDARGYPMTPEEQAELQDIERRQALGKWLNA